MIYKIKLRKEDTSIRHICKVSLFRINFRKLVEFKHGFGHDIELIIPKEVFDELKNYKEITKIEYILKF